MISFTLTGRLTGKCFGSKSKTSPTRLQPSDRISSSVFAFRVPKISAWIASRAICSVCCLHQSTSSAISRPEIRARQETEIDQQAYCASTAHESNVFILLGLALSEKQIPQIAENIEK